MARNTEPVLKRCRLLGIEPSVLGINKSSNRNIRENANRKFSEYAIQLREKQKLKFIYGVLEKKFLKYYQEASRRDGVTGQLILEYLERRLDNIIYRLGMVKTRRQARQAVTHGHFLVNGKKVNVPSFRVKQGDVITVKEASRDVDFIKEAVAEANTPAWLSMDKEKFEGKILENPSKDVLDFEVNEQLIVEFYSR